MIHEDLIEIQAEFVHMLTSEQAWHFRVLPKDRTMNTLSFFVDDKSNSIAIQQELEMLFDKSISLEQISSETILKSLNKYYKKEKTDSRIKGNQYVGDPDDFLANLISEAKSFNSSDIHIETYENKSRVRIRIDGMLIERFLIKKDDYPVLINKIKVAARLNISEKRLPQDGRIRFVNNGNRFDIRVSIVPGHYGEKAVLRLLSNDATKVDIKALGFSDQDLSNYLEAIKRPKGILLISGPTGSGKTTTLYATLKLLNEESRNLVTIEEPIEYTLEGINQVQVNEQIGLTFGAVLKSFLRQDPDVIMVGEIRDQETASLAIRAALTGHFVLATIHTVSAWGVMDRLSDLGVPPFLIGNTLVTTVAQRLLRILCPHCKEKQEFSDLFFPKHYKAPRKVSYHYIPVGCNHCHHKGYAGRKAVYEVIPIDYELSVKIKTSIFDVSAQLKERGIKTLAENSFELFEQGETSLEEIYSLLFDI